MTIERRRVRRRSLPFVRSGVLGVNGRDHIVAVLDLSPDSAFLKTKAVVKTHDVMSLRMILPRDGREVSLPCRFVRKLDGRQGYPTGIAVRFKGLDAGAIRRIEEFAAEGLVLPDQQKKHGQYRCRPGPLQCSRPRPLWGRPHRPPPGFPCHVREQSLARTRGGPRSPSGESQ